jgi:F-type H+-transporting ATPase subunit a
MEEHHKPFTWFGDLPAPEPVVTAGFVALLLIAFAVYVRPKLARTEAAITPERGFTARNFAETFVEAISGMAEGVIGHHYERYVPLLATFFIFILVSNLIGLVPGFAPPTADFNITFGLGVVAFFAYHAYGTREHGWKYVKQFLGPVVFLAPLMLVVELFSHMFRPVSLGIRLFANMFADHQVVEIFTDLTKVGVPVIFYVLGAFVGVVQAFVFTMLSAIYIALAISHDH